MASSRVSTAVTWPTATPSITLSTNAIVRSEAFYFNAEDWDCDLQISFDNQGTPASGDTVEVSIAWTAGDLSGGGGDDFDTDEYAQYLGKVDTVAANTPGEDPLTITFPIRSASKGFQLLLKANQGATRNIVCRAMVSAHRPQ